MSVISKLSMIILLNLAIPTSLVSSPRILAIGDSLTEGYGVAKSQNYISLLQEMLIKEGYPKLNIINAGTSGATSAFGVRTLRFQLKRQKPDLIIYALGSNDALRGIEVTETYKNIEDALLIAKKHMTPVILCALKAPPNYGKLFGIKFEQIYPNLAQKYSTTLMPFFLANVAGKKNLNLADGIHPNPEGHKVIAKEFQPIILNELKKLKFKKQKAKPPL